MSVIFGGTNDVGRNETSVGVRALNNFIKLLDHTNVIVLNVPHRHDLIPNSCVNDEVKVYNRKIGKLCGVYKNLSVLPVDSDRDLYTRHGLHLNAKGKEQIAQKVALMIKDLFSVKKVLPVALE
jgi:lysophospholipase L1-like esterase